MHAQSCRAVPGQHHPHAVAHPVCMLTTHSPVLHLHSARSGMQDIERSVRRCILDQLPLLARGLGREATCSKLLPEIMDLAGDEEAMVCCSALAALSSIAHLLTPGLPPYQQSVWNRAS